MAGTPASQPAVVSPLDGGLVVSAGSSELVAGFDAIRADLGGRYLLEFAAPATVAGGPVAVSVEVNAFGMAADARLELANRPAQTASPSSSPEPTSHTASTGWYVVIVVAGILLVAAVELGWIVTTHAKRSARSRRHQRAPRHAAHRH
jgi:hypothetical protein